MSQWLCRFFFLGFSFSFILSIGARFPADRKYIVEQEKETTRQASNKCRIYLSNWYDATVFSHSTEYEIDWSLFFVMEAYFLVMFSRFEWCLNHNVFTVSVYRITTHRALRQPRQPLWQRYTNWVKINRFWINLNTFILVVFNQSQVATSRARKKHWHTHIEKEVITIIREKISKKQGRKQKKNEHNQNRDISAHRIKW